MGDDVPDLERAADLYGEHRIRDLEDLVRLCVAGWADAERRVGTVRASWTPPAWVPRWAWPTDEQARRLRALDGFIADYEAAHGTITEQEIRAAFEASRQRSRGLD